MSYLPYQHYKPTDASGVTQIPSHWGAKRLRFVARCNPSRSEIDLPADALISFVAMDAVGERGGLTLDAERPLDEVGAGYTYFADDDVIVAKITPCFENRKGALATGLTNGVALGTTELHVLRAAEQINPKFLFYMSVSNHFRDIGESEMYGAAGQKRVPDAFIKNFRVALPPLPEQLGIVAVLDHETAQIDILIEKKRRLLEALEEKRVAVITHAVTKGLDPNVPMKDSGILWLGQIPSHFATTRVKFQTSFITSGSRGWAEYYTDDGAIFLQSGNIGSNMDLNFTVLQRVSPPAGAEGRRTVVRLGDVLVCITGARTGAVAHVSADIGEAYVNQHVALLRPIVTRIVPRFLSLSLWSNFGREQLWLSSYGMKEGLGLDHVLDVQIATPPLDEQKRITQYIDDSCVRIDTLTAKVRTVIEKLEEYRSALITAAVTGKIDMGRLAYKEAAE